MPCTRLPGQPLAPTAAPSHVLGEPKTSPVSAFEGLMAHHALPPRFPPILLGPSTLLDQTCLRAEAQTSVILSWYVKVPTNYEQTDGAPQECHWQLMWRRLAAATVSAKCEPASPGR